MKLGDFVIELPTVKQLRDIQSEARARMRQEEAEQKAQEKLKLEEATNSLVQATLSDLSTEMAAAAAMGESRCEVIKIAIGAAPAFQKAGEVLAKTLNANGFSIEWERDVTRGNQTMFVSWERQKKEV